MFVNKIYYLFLFFMLFNNYSKINAQSFGFGCLGLSGIYGGYTLQEFNAEGLNKSLNLYNSSNSKIDFKKSEGFRIGGIYFVPNLLDHF